MPTTSTSKDTAYVQSLLKEALYLTDEIAMMDKQIESDIRSHKTVLTKWIDDHPLAKWVSDWATDKAADESLKAVFDALCKTLKISTSMAGIAADVTGQVFSSTRQPSEQMAYLDTRPQLAGDYERKKRRLQNIYQELFYYYPPSATSLIQEDRCAKEACWQSLN